MTLSCDAALSDLVLQAAQQAAASHLGQVYGRPAAMPGPQFSERNRPLATLLESLLDSAESVANAINDNAWDESQPVDAGWVRDIQQQLRKLGSVIQASNDPPEAAALVPSMSGKELV